MTNCQGIPGTVLVLALKSHVLGNFLASGKPGWWVTLSTAVNKAVFALKELTFKLGDPETDAKQIKIRQKAQFYI